MDFHFLRIQLTWDRLHVILISLSPLLLPKYLLNCFQAVVEIEILIEHENLMVHLYDTLYQQDFRMPSLLFHIKILILSRHLFKSKFSKIIRDVTQRFKWLHFSKNISMFNIFKRTVQTSTSPPLPSERQRRTNL